MTSTIKVSVLIPCHSLTYLDQAIKSIAAQTMPADNFEVILVADRIKTSSAKNLLKNSVKNYIVYESSKPGIVNALNLGLMKSKSIYVARMDEDDLMEPNRLIQQSDFLDAHPECIVVGGQLKLINENGELFGVSRFQNKVVRRADLLRRSPIAHPAAMFRRERVVEIGAYRENLPEDWDLWTRLSQQGGLSNISSYVLRYRIHENQLSRSDMYRHTTSRLMIGTSLYAREVGFHDAPIEKLDSADWLNNTRDNLSKISVEYERFVREVQKENELNIALGKKRTPRNILKIIQVAFKQPKVFLRYARSVLVNRYEYWKTL